MAVVPLRPDVHERDFGPVLADCMVPGLDGHEATAEIRWREERGSRSPSVAMTAKAPEAQTASVLLPM